MTFVVFARDKFVDDIWRIHYIFKHHFGGLYPIAVEVGATDDSAGMCPCKAGHGYTQAAEATCDFLILAQAVRSVPFTERIKSSTTLRYLVESCLNYLNIAEETFVKSPCVT
jgi:hypothetical protein